MTRALVLALAIVAATGPRARASHCHEVSNVVGYEHCRRFAWWSHSWPVMWDFGAVAMSYTPPDALAGAPATHVASGSAEAAPIEATGVRVRELWGFGRVFYAGSEIDLAWFGDAHLVSDGRPVTSGSIAQMTAVVGVHHGLGPLLFGEELAPGAREVFGPPPAMPQPPGKRAPPLDAAFVLDLHEKIDLWLTPFVSLGVEGGVDLVNPRDVHLGVALGLHLAPFDNTR